MMVLVQVMMLVMVAVEVLNVVVELVLIAKRLNRWNNTHIHMHILTCIHTYRYRK